MEILDEVRSDVKEIKKFIFEGAMAQNYVTKEMFELKVVSMQESIDEKKEKIDKLEKNQNKVAWLIISAVILAVL